MTSPDSAQSIARFSERKEDSGRVMYPTRITVCECGWETKATNSSLYGPPNALDLAMMAHRIAHLEGRVKPPKPKPRKPEPADVERWLDGGA